MRMFPRTDLSLISVISTSQHVSSSKTSLVEDINFKTGAVSFFRLWNAVIDNDQCYTTLRPHLSYHYFEKLVIV